MYVNNKWDYIRFKPRSGIEKQSTCFILYPGALVSPTAYAPYGQALAAQGYYSYILKLPVGLAIFEPNAANDAKQDYYAEKYCTRFVISGHSLGGVTAANYVKNHPDDALLLLASYPEASADLTQISAPVTSIYGSNDCQTTPDDVYASAHQLPAHTRFIEIAGGNHQQFAWYSESVEPDCAASIDRALQFEQIIQEALLLLSFTD